MVPTSDGGDDLVVADTCNVTLAAASIDCSIANVYKWRGKDAAFRAAWDRALVD